MSAGPVFCSECGNRNDADAAFCEGCGQRLEGVEAPVPAAAEAAPAAPRKGISRNLLVIIGAVVLLAGGAFAFRTQLASLVGGNDNGGGGDGLTLPDSGMVGELADSAEGSIFVFPDTGIEELQIPPGAVITRDDGTVIPIPPSLRVTRALAAPPPPPPPPPDATIEVSPPPAPPPAPLPAEERLIPGVPAAPAATIAAGSVLALKATSQLCTDKSKVGDRIGAALQQDVFGPNGARIPQGSTVTFVVDQLKRGDETTKARTVFSVIPQSIAVGGQSYLLSATVDTVVLKKKGRGLLGAVVGAAAGVAAAKAAGGDTKTAVAGGIVGGAAGAVVGGQLEHGDGCIEKNALIRIRLSEDLTLERS